MPSTPIVSVESMSRYVRGFGSQRVGIRVGWNKPPTKLEIAGWEAHVTQNLGHALALTQVESVDLSDGQRIFTESEPQVVRERLRKEVIKAIGDEQWAHDGCSTTGLIVGAIQGPTAEGVCWMPEEVVEALGPLAARILTEVGVWVDRRCAYHLLTLSHGTYMWVAQ